LLNWVANPKSVPNRAGNSLADRPEGQRLLTALQPGDVVVAAKLDRAFRSAADALETLEELKKIG